MKLLPQRNFQRKNSGFNLTELLVVIGIMGILMAIAIPNYRDYVLKARRSAAQDVLMQIAQKQTMYLQYTRTGYADDGTVSGKKAVEVLNINLTQDAFKDYDFSVEADTPPPTFVATASPKTGGQVDGGDWIRIDNTGLREFGFGNSVKGNW